MPVDPEGPKLSFREMYPNLEYPNVIIEELVETSDRETSAIKHDDLGSPEKGARLGKILDRKKEAHIVAFKLTWQGGRTPRGIMLLGHEIGWTNRGTVVDTKGDYIGTYERVVDSGGEDGKQQIMKVFIDK